MVFASVKRESQLYASFNLKSAYLQTNWCCRHQVRSCFSSSIKNIQCLSCSRLFIFYSPLYPTGMDTISVPLKNTSDMHSRYKGWQSKVCGDRCADLYRKSSVGNTNSSLSISLCVSLSLIHTGSLQHCVIGFLSFTVFNFKNNQCPSSCHLSHWMHPKIGSPVIL